MGLPSGRLWADRNVGADLITDPGLYFQWGDVEGFSKDSGRNCNGKRNGERDWIRDYSATHGCMLGDSQNIPVDPYFDAARKNMGAPWRMPTVDEIQELFNSAYTTFLFETNYQGSGINGVLVTSKSNGNTLFFPESGYFIGGFYGFSEYGRYWTSSCFDNEKAYYLNIENGDDVYTEENDSRSCGFSVRAVQ